MKAMRSKEFGPRRSRRCGRKSGNQGGVCLEPINDIGSIKRIIGGGNRDIGIEIL